MKNNKSIEKKENLNALHVCSGAYTNYLVDEKMCDRELTCGNFHSIQ